jgi:hypothetical protein
MTEETLVAYDISIHTVIVTLIMIQFRNKILIHTNYFIFIVAVKSTMAYRRK